MQADERLRPTRCCDEFNADRVRGVDLDHGPKVTGPKTVGWDVMRQNDDVEGMQRRVRARARGRAGQGLRRALYVAFGHL